MTEGYLTPAGEGSSEYVEKKSRFLGQLFPVSSEEEAKARLEAVKKERYDARHHCWCYILRGGQKRYSDDGEPQGTAGQPMLNLLEREGVEDVFCVVTRYFGGTLLGTGGLVRAYSTAAKEALCDAGVNEMRQWASLRVQTPYNLYDRVRLEAEKLGAVFENTDYGAEITLSLLLPEETLEGFAAALRELSAGRLVPEKNGSVFRGVLRK